MVVGESSQQPVKDTTLTFQCSILTSTNYTIWRMRMEVLLGIHGVWDVVDPGSDDAKKNNIVKGLLFQLIPEDLVLQIGNLKTGKEMWEAIKTRNLGVDRVKEARLQTLITEFENLKMSDNKTIDAYAAKLSGIVSKSATLREVMSEHKLDVVGRLKGNNDSNRGRGRVFITLSHPPLKKSMSETQGGFEDVVGRLKAYEERVKEEDKANDPQENLLYARTDYSNRNNDSSRGRGCVSYSQVVEEARGQGRGQGNSQNQGQRDSSEKTGEDNELQSKWGENRLYKAQLKVGKEDTNEVGRESDKEVNPHSSSVTVYETSLESEEDNSRSDDTPNPLVRLETIRLLISLAAGKGWKIHHLEVKTYLTRKGLRRDQAIEICNEDLKRSCTTSFGIKYKQCTSPITWCLQKKATVVLSSCEAEFMAATTAACQAIWLREVLAEVTENEQGVIVDEFLIFGYGLCVLPDIRSRSWSASPTSQSIPNLSVFIYLE
ncbi:uncharacterized mitochondrial protein-like protein [Tanacetum coccineum]